MTTEIEAVADLQGLIRARERIDGWIEREIWNLRTRQDRASWDLIGQAMGVSKQAAHKKWSHLDDTEQEDLYDKLTTDDQP